MKKFYNIFLCALCAFAFFSCEKEQASEEAIDGQGTDVEVPEGCEEITLTAICEATKTSLDGKGNTLWSEDDQIKVICSDNTASDFTLVSGAGSQTGDFRGYIPVGKTALYAVYPAAAYSSVSGSTVKVTVPAAQTGTFAAGNIAVAKVAADHSMAFKNMNAFISFTLPSGTDVTSVEVESVVGASLGGVLSVNCAGESPVATSTIEGGASSITATTGSGAGTYFISVAPGVVHTKGFQLTYKKGSEVTGVYYLNRNITTAANKNYQMGTVETKGNYYVTVGGAGLHTGMDWANAFSKDEMWKRLTLTSDQAADAATKAAKIAAIDGATFHMAAGTYDFGEDPTISFNETNPVTITLKGGYNASTGEQAWTTNQTNITGNRTGSAGSFAGHPCLKIRGKMNVSLDGLRFINGYVSGDKKGALDAADSGVSLSMTDCYVGNNINDGSSATGAGIELYGLASFEATRVTIDNNTGHHAPGLYAYSTNLELEDCTISNNHATSWGGAFRNAGGSPTCSFTGCNFTGNYADSEGGCVTLYEGTHNFTNCTFTGNHCYNNGGAIRVLRTCTVNIGGCSFKGNYVSSEAGNGGAIRVESNNPTLNITGCNFGGTNPGEPNYSNGDGGALSLQVGTTTITNCHFIRNYALNDDAARESGNGYGGAIDCYNTANMTISGGTFSGNNAWRAGAINHSSSGEVSVSGATFTANGSDKTRHGGAARVSRNISFSHCTFGGASASDGNTALEGGAIYIQDNTTTINGGTFQNNTASNCGGAIYQEGSLTIGKYNNTEPTSFLTNAADSTGGAIYVRENGTTAVNYAVFKGNHVDAAYAEGGAIRLAGDSPTLTLSNCTFGGSDDGEPNHSAMDGGALSLRSGVATITDCDFVGNYASGTDGDGYGGAIDCYRQGQLNITGGTFFHNKARRAGAINVSCERNITITGTEFAYNGGSSNMRAGAIRSNPTSGNTMTLDGCNIHDCSAGVTNSIAGAIFHENGGGQLTLINCTITNCSAGYGGAISTTDGSYGELKIQGGSISNCSATGHGGAVCLRGKGTFNATNISSGNGPTFEGNHAADKGGAIMVENATTLKIFRCRFANNYAKVAGALYGDNKNNDSSNHPTIFIDECSFEGNYITDKWGPVLSLDGGQVFLMNNCSVKGSYTRSTSSDNQKDLKPSWICIDGIKDGGTVGISNCSIIGNVQYSSNGSSFTALTNNTALVAIWKLKSGSYTTYFANNIIVAETDGIASIRGNNGAEPVDLYYDKIGTIANVSQTGSNATTGLKKSNFGSMTWTESQKPNSYTTYGFWSWNGKINGSDPAKVTRGAMHTWYSARGSDYVKWMGSDEYVDQRRVSRGGSDSSTWWSGAYQ